MGRATSNADLSYVILEVRTELVRLGLAKKDLERRGIAVDDLNREVLRLFMERGQSSIAGIVGEILARVHLG